MTSPAYVRDSEIQARRLGWRWAVVIGERIIRRAITASVTYAEDGAASFELETDYDIRGLGRAPVRVYCGWGNLATLLFEGTLDDPIRDPFRKTSFASGYGVRGAMASQSFYTSQDFSGMNLPAFFYHGIARRLYDSRAVIDVREGFDVYLEDAEFEGESTLLEAAESVTQPTGHVMLDRPDFDLRVTLEPQPVSGVPSDVSYDASAWPAGELELARSTSGLVSRVVVFRRENIEGEEQPVEVVRAESSVDNPGPFYPKPNEIHWIPEFPGDQASAQRAADATALARAAGTFAGQMNDVWIDPRLIPPKTFRIVRLEEGLRVTYSSLAKSNTFDLITAKMAPAFAALKASTERILSLSPPPRRNPHLIKTVPETVRIFGRDTNGRITVDVETAPQGAWFGRDVNGRVYLDPETAPIDAQIGRDRDGKITIDVD